MEDGRESETEAREAQASKLFQTGVLLIYGKRKSIDKAIKCIQKAITIEDSDYKYWQLLGEAYYQRGSLNPAINCFMKSLTLAESKAATNDEQKVRLQADCVHSRLRVSDIRLSVGHLDEATAAYSEIIAIDRDNVAALVGLSKAELQTARNCFSAGLVQSGHKHCMRSLELALKAVKLDPSLCHTWKLASDCCLIQFLSGQRGDFSTKLNLQFPGSSRDGLVITRHSCIELAQRFLCKAVSIEDYSDSSCLWHNLGVSLYLKSTLEGGSKDRDLLLRKSLKCLLKALDFERDNSQIRNSIAIVAFYLNYLNTAQSFLIKSIQTNRSTSEIQFSNLGYIYLQKGEFRLASVAFSRCQAEEPLYCRSWLGNALINQQNNADNLLFLRHCHKLENNYESQLMFATKVTSLPSSEKFDKDIVNALDCMQRLVNYNYNSVEAKNTLGLLFERCKFHEQAKRCFTQAHKIAPQDSRVLFNRLRQHSARESGCPINSRSSSTLDTDYIKTAENLASTGGNREYMLNLIYYLFNNQDYKSINERMTRFIEKLPLNEVRSRVGAQIMLALVAKAEGEDFKCWLFKNLIDSEQIVSIETLINLFCLMLLGCQVDDQQLVAQVSSLWIGSVITYLSAARDCQFANTFHSEEGFWLKLTLVGSIFCLRDPCKLIRPLLALFPTIAELWLFLGLALMCQKDKQQTAAFCIQKAGLIGSTNADLCIVCDILLAILCRQYKVRSANMNSKNNYLSRVLFRFPNYLLLWDCLDPSPEKDGAHHQEKPKRAFSEQDSSLFHLAIDHTIKMIVG